MRLGRGPIGQQGRRDSSGVLQLDGQAVFGGDITGVQGLARLTKHLTDTLKCFVGKAGPHNPALPLMLAPRFIQPFSPQQFPPTVIFTACGELIVPPWRDWEAPLRFPRRCLL